MGRLVLENVTRTVPANPLRLVLGTRFSTVSTQVLISNLAAMSMYFSQRKTFWLSSTKTQLLAEVQTKKLFEIKGNRLLWLSASFTTSKPAVHSSEVLTFWLNQSQSL